MSCRIHPGETVASYVGEGLMDKLVEMEEMLKSTVFKIIPILNPDGVVLGNFRTSTYDVIQIIWGSTSTEPSSQRTRSSTPKSIV